MGGRTGRSASALPALPALLLALLVAMVAVQVSGAPPGGADGNEAPGAPFSARSVAAGSNHTCVLFTDGRVKCWGQNGFGTLGLGDAQNRGDAAGEMGDDLPAVNLGTGRTATALTAGSFHTCALLDDATVKCWGSNAWGQLGRSNNQTIGDGAGEMGDDLAPVALGAGAIAIAGGDGHTCAILTSGAVKCWGNNQNGQLGLGDTTQFRGASPNTMGANLPTVDLGPGRTAVAITAGKEHTCALLDNDLLKCWGDNGFGQLGQGDTFDRGDAAGEMGANLPTVPLNGTVTAVTAGSFHTCALLDGGAVKCWGRNDFGVLGLGDLFPRGDEAGEMGANLPSVPLAAGALAVSASQDHTCARLDGGVVKCWGRNGDGQLGQGDALNRGSGPGEMGANLAPISLGAGRTATAVLAGGFHSCARLDNGEFKCWGFNISGQLGLGDAAARGDEPGEMGDDLPAVALGPDGPAPQTCDGRTVTVDLNQSQVPTAGDDVILGTPGPDTINALGGNDRVCAGGGGDTVNGGPGNDRLFGGAGIDVLNGNDDNDVLAGGDQNDRLDGGGQRDTASGGPGDDRVEGGGGDDTLNGDGGEDTVVGEAGADRLNGGPQRDTCNGGPQRDTQSGCEVRTGIP